MLYCKITPKNLNTIIYPLTEIESILSNASSGEKFEIEIVEMTEKEYDMFYDEAV